MVGTYFDLQPMKAPREAQYRSRGDRPVLQVKIARMADYKCLHQQVLSLYSGVARLESSFAARDVVEREIGI